MLSSRLLVGLPLFVLLLLAIFWPGSGGAVVFAGLAGAGIYAAFTEFSSMAESMGVAGPHRALRYFSILLLLSIIYAPLTSSHGAGSSPMVMWPAELVLLAAIVLFCFGHVFRGDDYAVGFSRAAMALAGLVIVYGSLNFVVKIFFSNGLASEGRYLLFFVGGATKAGDVGAYAMGTLSNRRPGGNHKIVPHISPKKSWEGLIGGVLVSTVTAMLIYLFLGESLLFCGQPVLSWGSTFVLGITFGFLGFFGDISESALKRAAHFDDSGAIPGLGGVLDLTDSLLFVLPLFFAFITAQVIF